MGDIGEGYGGTVEAKSGRSKMNCRSTMEYELVELHQSLPAVLWIRMFLSDLGFPYCHHLLIKIIVQLLI